MEMSDLSTDSSPALGRRDFEAVQLPHTRLRTGSVFGDNRAYSTGCNWSACLRSGRWLRPGDFARDKVQSRGVLVFGLLATLVLIVLLTISDTAFLFPRSFASYGDFSVLILYFEPCIR
jgi:hypothetical protein